MDDKPALLSHIQTTAEYNQLGTLPNNSPGACDKPLLQSQPIRIPATRRLPLLASFRKSTSWQNTPQTLKALAVLDHLCTLRLNPAIPIQIPIHRILVAKRAVEKSGLDKYEKAGIIEKVDELTPWCSNEIIRETPRKVRICIDPSQTVNKAILRPLHQMPILNEQLHKLCQAKCFSLVDVREGFLHIPLDEESSRIPTMHTSFCRYRWQRLPFRITSAHEEFQMRLMTVLGGLAGTICIADDILVFGEGKDFIEAEQDHDRRFVTLMECYLKENIKLNPMKLQLKLLEVKVIPEFCIAHSYCARILRHQRAHMSARAYKT